MLFAQGAPSSEILQSPSADHPLITPAYQQPVACSLKRAQPVRLLLFVCISLGVSAYTHWCTRLRQQVESRRPVWIGCLSCAAVGRRCANDGRADGAQPPAPRAHGRSPNLRVRRAYHWRSCSQHSVVWIQASPGESRRKKAKLDGAPSTPGGVNRGARLAPTYAQARARTHTRTHARTPTHAWTRAHAWTNVDSAPPIAVPHQLEVEHELSAAEGARWHAPFLSTGSGGRKKQVGKKEKGPKAKEVRAAFRRLLNAPCTR